jgi:hypothetical protein
MKKIILSLAVVAIATLTATAQKESSDKSLKFSIGVEAGLPIGSFKNSSKFGIGGSAQAEYMASENVGLTGRVGYLSFAGKTTTIGEVNVKLASISVIPVMVGGKFYFNEKVFGHAEAGLSFFNRNLGSVFTYAPGIGVKAGENVEVEVKYQGASKNGGSISFIGLRAAFTF